MAGVERQMLDRIGGEVARATSRVCYAPNSYFPAHTHDGGEEFFVLDGVFSDEHGDYPAGTYVRNPIGTSHSPHSKDGCTIFVKLHQFAADDSAQFAVDTRTAGFQPGLAAGISILPLHRHDDETCKLVRWQAGARAPGHVHPGGAEVLVLEGELEDEQGRYAAGSWLRLPPGARHRPRSAAGCLLYVKVGGVASLRGG